MTSLFGSDWKGFEARQHFRGAFYQIQLERCGPGNGLRLEADRKPIDGTVIPIPPAGTKEVLLLARIG